MSRVMNARKSRYTHGWIKDEDMVKIEDHIDDPNVYSKQTHLR